ncbi:hypothetical protein LEP1GSC105_4816 [Leptospira interrogans str. UI 12758]|uniref:Uncharacterized protein n=1 Tax=Leptospira interrogans str. UI 12758 TaxID=1049938 RepID=A0A0E2D057_LEPIR|nr:hypothetical protein LEP1GSC105_4816 [Leptospira interrogans str. UI 12758]
MQKVCFSDREKFSEPSLTQKIGKTQHKALYESRWKTQHNAFLWVALENSTQRFPMGRVVEWELSFTEDFVVIPTIDLEIQLFVGLVMIKNSIEFEKFRRIGAESAVQPTTGFCSNFLR